MKFWAASSFAGMATAVVTISTYDIGNVLMSPQAATGMAVIAAAAFAGAVGKVWWDDHRKAAEKASKKIEEIKDKEIDKFMSWARTEYEFVPKAEYRALRHKADAAAEAETAEAAPIRKIGGSLACDFYSLPEEIRKEFWAS